LGLVNPGRTGIVNTAKKNLGHFYISLKDNKLKATLANVFLNALDGNEYNAIPLKRKTEKKGFKNGQPR
jgi:hypothetical protein